MKIVEADIACDPTGAGACSGAIAAPGVAW
jgi:hypothetical protein